MPGVEGFMYPNEIELQWSVLIVLYPFLTGLVAGAFILASLERVFQVEAVKPTYRLALLTALAFLLVAPLPLQLHLGHPERSYEMYLTPHRTSAMAMFGFVYLWYLMAVLVLEIWLDYRRDIVLLSQSTTGWTRWIYRAMTLGNHEFNFGLRSIERARADAKFPWLSANTEAQAGAKPFDPYMVAAIDGFRWCILRGQAPIYWPGFLMGTGVSAALLWLGIRQFRRTERTFADLI